MLILRQSTSLDIRMGPFVDATDGVTPETGITLGGADQAEVLKADGAATAAMAGTFAAVTGADGWYDYTVQTGDVDTVGEVVFVVQDASVCLPVFVRGMVVEESVYDRLYAASAVGPLTAAEVNAELLDVLGTDTQTLPGQGAPPLSPTLIQILTWLYKLMRNAKKQSATEFQVLADDESTVDHKAATSTSGGVTTVGELASGP